MEEKGDPAGQVKEKKKPGGEVGTGASTGSLLLAPNWHVPFNRVAGYNTITQPFKMFFFLKDYLSGAPE